MSRVLVGRDEHSWRIKKGAYLNVYWLDTKLITYKYERDTSIKRIDIYEVTDDPDFGTGLIVSVQEELPV